MRISSLLKSSSSKGKPKVCQICDRTFANGKAMGGHMRSHLAKLPLPPKPKPSPDLNYLIPLVGSPSSTTSNNNANRQEVVLIRSACCGEAVNVPKQDLDCKNENESKRNLTRKRSERQPRRTMVTIATSVVDEPSTSSHSVSSLLSHSSTDEEVALCLLKLLKEKQSNGKNPNLKQTQNVESKEVEEEEEDSEESYEEEEEEEEEEESENDGDDDAEDEDDLLFTIARKKEPRGKYKCEACNKVFRSYQALGGHRANHKNKRMKISSEEDDDDSDERSSVEQRSFPCPSCDKVFNSGQALGGHKKVHLSYLGISKTDQNKSAKNKVSFDLNFPAPEE